jgi:hypothetical protein
MHEVYDVPRKHWENIYVNNYHASGIGTYLAVSLVVSVMLKLTYCSGHDI